MKEKKTINWVVKIENMRITNSKFSVMTKIQSVKIVEINQKSLEMIFSKF